jgi:hypothetical protein
MELIGAGPSRDRGAAGSLESVARTMASNTLVPCPDCGHLVSRAAETCPLCACPLRTPAPHEGLFLRTMNLWVKVILGFIVFVLVVPFLIAVAAYVTSRLLP